MPDLPAVCDRCGAFFRSGLHVDDSRNVTIRNVEAGPCPACGGMGHVPDGVYDFVGDVITVLQAPDRTIAELHRFQKILESAQRRHEAPRRTAERVERELPVFKAVAAEFRRAPVSTAGILVGLVLTAIGVVLGAWHDAAPKHHDVIVEQVINNYVITLPSDTGKPKPTRSAHKPGRNEPCICGSGKKYKHCCGAGER